MAKYTPDEARIRQITEKYIKNLKLDVEKIPDIHKVIAEALKAAHPEGELNPSDIGKVVKALVGKTIINDKVITEVAKSVADNSALEDLVFSINQYIKQLKTSSKQKTTKKDVEEIIKLGKLDPHSSTPFQIKNAVRDYFNGARPLEAMGSDELRDLIKTHLSKHGPVDERDVNAVVKRVLKGDKDKPVQTGDIDQAIRQHFATKPTTNKPETEKDEEPGQAISGPPKTQVDRPAPPVAGAPDPDKPKAPDARTGSTRPPVEGGAYVPPDDPKNLTFFDKIRKKMHRYGLTSLTRNARNWLMDTITKAKNTPPRKKLIAEGDAATALVGNMFMYFYDAKWKKKLPYWDMFPLIFVVDVYDDGWLGLNLHYLPMMMRIKLFDRLLTLADDSKLDQITRLKLSYELIKSVATFPEARPCVKRYLTSQVKSALIKVEPHNWEIAVFLPVEQFQKQTKEKVWKDSKKKVKK